MKLIVDDRIHLTELRATDRAACLEHLSDKQIYEMTLRLPYPFTEASFNESFAIVEKDNRENGQPVHWAIRNNDGFLIGRVGFSGFTIGNGHRAEIGYWLARPYWGRGIMTAVVNTACTFAFSEWKLAKISAEVFALNVASGRVLEKCGFEQEGYLRKHFLKDGELVDVKLFARMK